MRELRKESEIMYDNAYEGDYAKKQFINGAEALFKKLRTSNVAERSKQLKDFAEWLQSNTANLNYDLKDLVDEYLKNS